MLEMNRAQAAVEPQASPIPKLERENVRSRANLQNHAAAAGAVYRSGRYQKVVVFFGRPSVYVLIGGKGGSALLRCLKGFRHRHWIHIVFQPQENASIRTRV